MARSFVRVAVHAACASAALALLRPWTVQPIQTSPVRTFDAAAYVAEAWPRVIQEATRAAVPIDLARGAAAAPAAGPSAPRRPVFVTATGVVTDVDRRSRVGVLYLEIAGGQGLRAAVQVGPVLRGTSLRDALSFLRFTDFANQTEFAAVANALNDRVLRDVLAGLDVESLRGQALSITGVATLSLSADDRPIDVVPVAVQVAGGGR